MAVPFQHPTADMTGNSHDGGIRCDAFGKLGYGEDRGTESRADPLS
jgi:hypothetical protein